MRIAFHTSRAEGLAAAELTRAMMLARLAAVAFSIWTLACTHAPDTSQLRDCQRVSDCAGGEMCCDGQCIVTSVCPAESSDDDTVDVAEADFGTEPADAESSEAAPVEDASDSADELDAAWDESGRSEANDDTTVTEPDAETEPDSDVAEIDAETAPETETAAETNVPDAETAPETTEPDAMLGDELVNDECTEGWFAVEDATSTTSECARVQALELGRDFSCLLSEGGTILCWGAVGALVVDAPRTAVPIRIGEVGGWQTLSVGYDSACGIRDGAMYCWGRNGITEAMDPVSRVGDAVDWTAVAVGGGHACGLRHGALYCWGANYNGQLGIGSRDDVNQVAQAPTRVGTASDWTLIRAGLWHTCGLRSGELYCWGGGSDGEVGDGTLSVQVAPTRVGAERDWVDVAPGGHGTCGIRAGELYCWGYFWYWSTDFVKYPTMARIGTASDWSAIRVGNAHGCGLRDRRVYCWGLNGHGELGDGTFDARTTPGPITSSGNWSTVEVGEGHTCGMRDGQVFCWGGNASFQGGSDWSARPQSISIGVTWSNLDSGWYHSCGVGRDISGADRMLCWGSNADGQLGDGTRIDRTRPQVVTADADWGVASAGYKHSCGIRQGALYCWGDNGAGQLGLGEGAPSRSLVPARVGAESDWTTVDGGGQHSCGIRQGALYCWGVNRYQGQVGDGSGEDAVAPVRIGTDSDWTSVVAGDNASCGIRAGELFCWGALTGDIQFGPIPTKVGDATAWSAVALGASHACGLLADRIYCVGDNMRGQVAPDLGAEVSISEWVEPWPGEPWDTLGVGARSSCAIRSGELSCWGSDPSGAIGVGHVDDASDWTRVTGGTYHLSGLRDGTLYSWGTVEGPLGRILGATLPRRVDFAP